MQTETDFQYASTSTFIEDISGKGLQLSHAAELEEVNNVPCFFWGTLTDPFLTAKCLTTVAKVVRSRFIMTMQEMAAMRDPIVTAGAEKIRFEGFSSCNGVYARLDLLPEALDGEFIASGTTNVDFNDPMINALNAITKTERVVLSVGQKDVTIATEKTKVVEKKVSLPNRWIKGLTSVQLFLSDMEEIFVLNRSQAMILFQSLPKANTKTDYFIVQRGGKTMFSPIATGKSAKIGGVHRLRLLENVLPYLDNLYIYALPDGESSAFVAMFGKMRLVFALSADVYRGFSGEGKALENLITDIPLELVYGINSILKANDTFNPMLFSIENDIDFGTTETLSSSLSSIGLLGFDLLENQHFYRRLPFKTERILSLNPRLKNAKKLIAEDEITIEIANPNYTEAKVKGTGGVFHKVIISQEQARCTCNWFTNYQGKRGLCKHILAVKMSTQQ
jgi:SWIM zinc finger